MLKSANKDVSRNATQCTTVGTFKGQKLGRTMISLDGFDCAGHPGEADVGNRPTAGGRDAIPYVTSGGVGDANS